MKNSTTKTPAAKGQRVTIKSIVERGIKKGLSIKRMMAQVAKTGREPLERSIKWYVSKLGQKHHKLNHA